MPAAESYAIRWRRRTRRRACTARGGSPLHEAEGRADRCLVQGRRAAELLRARRAQATAASSNAVPMRGGDVTRKPSARVATCRLAGCWSRATESRPTMARVCDEDGGVRVTPSRGGNAARRNVPPTVRRQSQPSARSYSGAELGESPSASVASALRTSRPHPAAASGSPAAASFPSSNVTADAPPK
jgi:hypothetical protein